MPKFRKLATLATAAAAAASYAKKNPDQAAKFVDQAAQFVDKQTKGKYSSQISGAAAKAKSAVGISRSSGAAFGQRLPAGRLQRSHSAQPAQRDPAELAGAQRHPAQCRPAQLDAAQLDAAAQPGSVDLLIHSTRPVERYVQITGT